MKKHILPVIILTVMTIVTLGCGGHGADDYQGLLNRSNEALAESNKKGNVTTIYGHGDDKEQNNE